MSPFLPLKTSWELTLSARKNSWNKNTNQTNDERKDVYMHLLKDSACRHQKVIAINKACWEQRVENLHKERSWGFNKKRKGKAQAPFDMETDTPESYMTQWRGYDTHMCSLWGISVYLRSMFSYSELCSLYTRLNNHIHSLISTLSFIIHLWHVLSLSSRLFQT